MARVEEPTQPLTTEEERENWRQGRWGPALHSFRLRSGLSLTDAHNIMNEEAGPLGVARKSEPDPIVEFRARVYAGEGRYPDYDFPTAIERASKFMVPDRATRDLRGDLIIFGETYYDRLGHELQVAGLDLRNHGWVFAWSNSLNQYVSAPSVTLTPAQQ